VQAGNLSAVYITCNLKVNDLDYLFRHFKYDLDFSPMNFFPFFPHRIHSLLQGSKSATWFDCHRCGFTWINTNGHACRALESHSEPPPPLNCSAPSYTFLDHALYAAQLAWWLQFFPPSRFLVVSSWQLRDPIERVKVRSL
jgi:hypothetical protein